MSIVKHLVLVPVLLCILFLGAAQAFFFSSHDEVEVVDGFVVLDVADFDDGQTRFYQLDHQGRTIKFFVVRSSDGVIRAAFDACDVCWQSRKGYSQEGEYMVCNNCGRRFHSTMINEVEGGCNPAPLTREIREGRLYISLEDITPGARFF